MNTAPATIVHEYGPFPGVEGVHGVTYDGQHVWFASGDKLNAFDPASGKILRSIDVAAHARSWYSRGLLMRSMLQCLPSSPTVSRGRVQHWRLHLERASVRCNERSTCSRKQGRCSRLVTGELAVG